MTQSNADSEIREMNKLMAEKYGANPPMRKRPITHIVHPRSAKAFMRGRGGVEKDLAWRREQEMKERAQYIKMVKAGQIEKPPVMEFFGPGRTMRRVYGSGRND
jgi:hypothetical protein